MSIKAALVGIAALLLPANGQHRQFPRYDIDGAGRSIRLYVGTYVGSNGGQPVRLQIEAVDGYIYAAWIPPGSMRNCMIAETFSGSPPGLVLEPGVPHDYMLPYPNRLFAMDALPVLALEKNGLASRFTDGGSNPPLHHYRRIASRPDHSDMYQGSGKERVSCLP